jgi:hypothetical protein
VQQVEQEVEQEQEENANEGQGQGNISRPLIYEVEPSDVWAQGPYEKTMRMFQLHFFDEIERTGVVGL